MAQTLEDRLSGMTLTEEEEEIVVCDDEEDEVVAEQIQHCLVGKLFTSKPFSVEALKNTMRSAWRPMKGLVVREIESNLFIFQFFALAHKLSVLEDGSWQFDGSPLLVKSIKRGEQPSKLFFVTIRFRVKIKDVPFERRKKSMVVAMAQKMGSQYDESDPVGWGKYMRVRVDVMNPSNEAQEEHPNNNSNTTANNKDIRVVSREWVNYDGIFDVFRGEGIELGDLRKNRSKNNPGFLEVYHVRKSDGRFNRGQGDYACCFVGVKSDGIFDVFRGEGKRRIFERGGVGGCGSGGGPGCFTGRRSNGGSGGLLPDTVSGGSLRRYLSGFVGGGGAGKITEESKTGLAVEVKYPQYNCSGTPIGGPSYISEDSGS
ncbi:hypothetical protein SOVF_179060 [Spinacia oleracea]|nr:hypothetical protein SOVF_179060 [Spinacia oleracea]